MSPHAAGAAGSQGSSAFPRTGTAISLFGPDWAGGAAGRTAAQWQEAAQTHAVLIGRSVYIKWLPQLHSWNPALRVLWYDIGPYTIGGSNEFVSLLAQHPDYFAHDAAGNLVTDASVPNDYLMDLGNPGYQAYKVTRVVAELQASGMDGLDLDSMGDGPMSGYTSAVPVDPLTGQTYTAAEWLTSSVALIDAVKLAVGPLKAVIFNGFRDASDYFANANILATSMADGGIDELWLRTPGAPVTSFPNSHQWRLDVQMVNSVVSHHMAFFAWTKLWRPATAADQAAWDTFTMASYLLARTGQVYVNFLPSNNVDRTSVFYPDELTDLGAPLGPRQLTGTTWTRQFTFGTVTLTPGPTESATITTH